MADLIAGLLKCSLLIVKGINMIHRFKNNGYNIVLDVNSGSVHVVDDIAYDAIQPNPIVVKETTTETSESTES